MNERNYGFYDDGEVFSHCYRIGFIKKAIKDLKEMIKKQGIKIPIFDVGSSYSRLHSVNERFLNFFNGNLTLSFINGKILLNNEDEELLTLFYNKLSIIELSLKDLDDKRFLIVDKTDRYILKTIQNYLVLSDFFNSEGKLILSILNEEKEKDLKP